jgi:hypothetical protein
MKSSYLRIRCFLEGLEVPIISANVSASIGDIARASVEMIATQEILSIRPKTSISVFFLDDTTRPVSSSESGIPDKYYKILFSGEVSSISISKTSEGRVATLTCTDHFENMSRAYVYFTESAAKIDNLLRSKAYFASANIQENSVNQANISLLADVFKNPQPKYEGLSNAKGLLGAIIHTIELYTGIYTNSKAGANAFFTYQQERLRILEQIGIFSNDTNSLQMYQGDVISQFIARTYGIQGGLMKLSDTISMVLNIIGYVKVPNPTATPYTGTSRENVETNDVLLNSGNDLKSSLDQSDTVQNLVSGMFGSVDVLKNVANASTIGDVKEALKESPVQSSLRNYVDTIIAQAPNTFEMNILAGDISELAVNILSQTTTPDNKPNDFSAYTYNFTNKSSLKLVEANRIKSTLMFPELLYADPPTCNIIFPNMYTNLNFSRQSDSETTRLQLVTNLNQLGNNTDVADISYYAPSFDFLNSIQGRFFSQTSYDTLSKVNSDTNKRQSGSLMDHEMFTGVVPEFASMARLSSMISGLNFESANVNTVDEKVDFFARYADFMFIQRRLAQRSLSCSGPFNPYPVVGFPILVLDQPNLDSAEQFLGVLQNLTHSINQSGGSTSYTIAYARPTSLKDDAFFDGIADDLREALRPKWLNDEYKPERISEVYMELIGCKSIYQEDQKKAVKSIQNSYNNTASKSEKAASNFSWNYIKRDIASMDFMQNKFYGSKLKKSERLSNVTATCVGGAGPASSEHRKTVPMASNSTENVKTARVNAVINYINSLKTRSLIV